MKTHPLLKLLKTCAITGIVFILALPVSACAPATSMASRNADYASAPMAEAPKAAPAPASPVNAADADVNLKVAQQAALRLIVRNADLTIVVSNTQAQIEAIGQIATDYKGYIVSVNTNKIGLDVQGTLTLRVDSAQLDAALQRIRNLAVEVRNENVRGDDVTAEFVDLESQRKNLEAAEAQLQELLKRAEKTEDVMTIFTQLTQIRGQIEQVKGRMKFLSQSAALATINLTLIPDREAQPVQVAGWRPSGVAKDALESLADSLQGLANFAIWFVIAILPVLAILAIPFVLLFMLIRRIRRNRRNKSAKIAVPVLVQETQNSQPAK